LSAKPRGLRQVKHNPEFTFFMRKENAILFSVYFFSVLLAGMLWSSPKLLLLSYVFISFGMLMKWHSKKDLIYYLVAFILGSAGEIFAVYSGAWSYAKPFFYIPLWLPFLWGIASLFMMRFSESLEKIIKVNED